MRAGNLDRVIKIERATETLDSHGAPVATWSNLYPHLRAQLMQASAEEFMRAYGASSESVVIFRTRYVEGVTLADRVVYDGQNYDIKELKEIGRRRGLELRTVAHGGV